MDLIRFILSSPWVSIFYLFSGLAGVLYFKGKSKDYLNYYASLFFMTIFYIVIYESKISFVENNYEADTHLNGIYMLICSSVYLHLIKNCRTNILSNSYVCLLLCFLLTAPLKWYDIDGSITGFLLGEIIEKSIGLFVVSLDIAIICVSLVHARKSRSDI